MPMFIPYEASMVTTAGIPYKQQRLGEFWGLGGWYIFCLGNRGGWTNEQ